MKRRRRKSKKTIIYLRFVCVLILIFILLNARKSSYSKYKSTATSTADVDLAFYFAKVGDISQELKLESILPQTDSYTYVFTVSNFDGNKRTETAIDYTIELKTTTNLPLEYAIHKQNSNTNLITSTTTAADSDGTYFQTIIATGDSLGFTTDETHTYELEISFPERYNSAQYENIVEYIRLTVNSTQKTS